MLWWGKVKKIIFTCWHQWFITVLQYTWVHRTYKLWQGTQGTHKIWGKWKHFVNTTFQTVTLLASQGRFRCGSALQRHWQRLIHPVTKHRVIQIHNGSPFDYRLTVPTTSLLEFNSIYCSAAHSQNTVWIDVVCREGKERWNLIYYAIKRRGFTIE